ncbi:MAG: hypothetical protein GQ564_20515 [Bacteroidales bacterium]|nr:hypothetical protein [Bacteroidales bacterium]
MKKMNFFKIAFTLVLAISFSVAFGQAKDANLTEDQTVDMVMTVGTEVPFYVAPDAYFNPGYVGPGWTITSSFLWSFAVDPASFSFDAVNTATTIAPDITIGTAGSYVLNVVETSTDGCAGTTRSVNVDVLDAPTADFSVGDVEQCGDYTAAVLVDIADNTATLFEVDYTLVVQNYLADKVTVDGAVISTTPITDVALGTPGAAQTLIASATYGVLNTKVTRYTFTIDGVNDAVSRVSDYIPSIRDGAAANTLYASLTDDTFIVTVLPSPTTGPIFHLAN